jgi:hypothetical protein
MHDRTIGCLHGKRCLNARLDQAFYEGARLLVENGRGFRTLSRHAGGRDPYRLYVKPPHWRTGKTASRNREAVDYRV